MLPTSTEARVYNPASQNKEFLSLAARVGVRGGLVVSSQDCLHQPEGLMVMRSPQLGSQWRPQRKLELTPQRSSTEEALYLGYQWRPGESSGLPSPLALTRQYHCPSLLPSPSRESIVREVLFECPKSLNRRFKRD